MEGELGCSDGDVGCVGVLLRVFEALHQIDEGENPVMEQGLVAGWEEGSKLPVHDCGEGLSG